MFRPELQSSANQLMDFVESRVMNMTAELRSRVVRLEWLVIACLTLSLISLGVAGVLVRTLLFR